MERKDTTFLNSQTFLLLFSGFAEYIFKNVLFRSWIIAAMFTDVDLGRFKYFSGLYRSFGGKKQTISNVLKMKTSPSFTLALFFHVLRDMFLVERNYTAHPIISTNKTLIRFSGF